MFYPGADVAQKYMKYDPDLANSILDGLGLTERDAEGFRLREDGKRFEMKALTGTWPEGEALLEIMKPMWEAIGIELEYSIQEGPYSTYRAGEAYMVPHGSMSIYQENPWSTADNDLVALNSSYMAASGVGNYIASKGEVGVSKGPDPSYLPLASPDTYPMDNSGLIARQQDLWAEGRGLPIHHPRRIEIGKQLFTNYAEELMALPTVGFTGTSRGVFFNRNNMLGQPKTHRGDIAGYGVPVYYFDGGTPESRGRDNFNHPGNKSTFNSFSFLQGG